MTNINLIKAYREQAELSQQQLGDCVGVTRQTIGAWEQGDRTPSVVQLMKVAKALKVSMDLLLATSESTNQEIANQGILFRADKPAILTQTTQAYFTRKSKNYAFLEQITGELPNLPEMRPLPDYNEHAVEDVARDVREWFGVGEGAPLGNVLERLEAKGLKIILDTLPQEVSGFSAYTETNGAVIFINQKHPTERLFFTALHELGHLIFHRAEYRKAQPPARSKDPREKTANHFAGAVLLSREILERELYAYRNRWIPEPLLADIKQRYAVSLRTILYRASQLGFISQRQSGQQIGKLNKKYGIDQEQPELPKPQGLRRLERLTYLALINDEITASKAAEILDLPLIEIRQNLTQWMEEESD